VITNVIDHGMNLQQAIDAPRIHHQWLPDEIMTEPLGIVGGHAAGDGRARHKFSATQRYMSDAQGIMIERGRVCASAEVIPGRMG
jgi:gamma-glutamyltranspeptidase/glutathione hydrolase